MAPVVSLKRAFRSGADDNSEVHTICVVKETSKVWLCQQLSDRDNNDYRKAIFTLAGAKLNLQDDTAPARVTWKMISGACS
nr:hypothetical protein BaRGS_030208 [Batillaria attramentaria]